MPKGSEPETSGDTSNIERVILLLQEALEVLDTIGDSAHLGARLQEVLDELHERLADLKRT